MESRRDPWKHCILVISGWLSHPRKLAHATFIHPKQFGTSPKRLVLPYLYEEILSGQEEGVSSIRNGFSVWVKTDPQTLVRRHVVDARGLYPAFREAPARRHDPSLQEYRLNDKVPNRLTEQRRLSVNKWNPGLRRGNEAAIEKLIAGKIALHHTTRSY